MKTWRMMAVMLAVGLFAAGTATATTWSGATSTDFEDGTNWVGGTAPADDTVTDLAEFNNAPPANQPLLTKDRSVKGIYFSGNGGGWDIFNSGTTYTLSLGQYGVLNHQSGTCKIGSSAVLSISDAATDMKTDNGYLDISAKITGTGGLKFTGIRSDNNQRYFYIRGDNDYTGTTNLGQSAWVRIYHANAFGSAANTVTVSGLSGWRDEARLYIDADAGPAGLNANKAIQLGPYGSLYVASGITLTNDINVSGTGNLLQSLRDGTGDRYLTGDITLNAGAGLTIHRGGGGGSSPGSMYLNRDSGGAVVGKITGAGSITVTGSDSYDQPVYFYGDNDYSGGTTIKINYGADEDVRVASDTAFGTGPVTLVLNTSYPTYDHVLLTKDCTMANEFRGEGRIKTGAYVLTSTGEFAPGSSIGEIYVEDLDFQGTYDWEYDETDSDLISTATLAFGGASPVLNVSWLGAGGPATGDYVLMTYTGADPTMPEWTIGTVPVGVTGPLDAEVWLDADNNQVMLTLSSPAVPEPAGLGLFGLALLGLKKRKRS